jgi:hypothetical protein
MAVVVVALFVLPLVIGLAVGSVKAVEFGFNRDIVSARDVARTVVAIAGLGAATVAGWFATGVQDLSDTGPGFTWGKEVPVLIVLVLVEAGWIRLVCRPTPRPFVPAACAVASIGFVVWLAFQAPA